MSGVTPQRRLTQLLPPMASDWSRCSQQRVAWFVLSPSAKFAGAPGNIPMPFNAVLSVSACMKEKLRMQVVWCTDGAGVINETTALFMIAMTKRSIWFSLRSSLWLIPLFSLLLSAIVALVMVQIDLVLDWQIRQHWPVFLKTGPDGARVILSTVGSSMITVAGVVFSITIVALSLTANQYSPRVLRNFMRDRLNQTVLGVFFGVFMYSLLVLQAVGSGDPSFVPRLALWLAVLLAVVAIIFLISFIHHTATSIQVSEIVARIADETVTSMRSAKKVSSEGGSPVTESAGISRLRWDVVTSCRSGFVQDVDVEGLFQLACKRRLTLRVECPVGDFVMVGKPLVSVSGAKEIDKKLEKDVRRFFGINSFRTIEQDPEFGVRQIVDIALRALSPGINDATTAINCVDYLGVVLHCAARVKPSPVVHADGPQPRLLLPQVTPLHLADVALNEIRQNASNNVAVLLRMLRLLRQLLEDVAEPQLRAHLRRHAHLVSEEAVRGVPAAVDRAEVERALQRVLAAGPSRWR